MVAGLMLRVFATGGELWLDEVWSLLKIADLSSPLEILTKVKHDNNHLLNSLWMWVWGPLQTPFIYRAPSLLFSALLLILLMASKPTEGSVRASMLWLILVAFSYPLILQGVEARGYSLTLLCATLAFLSLVEVSKNPSSRRAIFTFSAAGIIGSLSHAIYLLFLAPSIVWLIWRLSAPPLKAHSRAVLWLCITPPILFACLLTFTFYRNMEIGGAPRLPYLEVAASTISVSCGGEPLSSIHPAVTGGSLILAFAVTLVCLAELVAWLRSGSPIAWLVGLILVTPWIVVSVLQPHFILPRYFIIQILFAYLLAARFLERLMRQGRVGAAIAVALLGAYIFGNTTHSLTLATMGRSHFVEIFEALASRNQDGAITVGGDQDFQNGLRLQYAHMIAPSTSRLVYVRTYREALTPPRFIIRETLEAYTVFPDEITLSQGTRYRAIQRYRAPLLNGSHVTVYEKNPE